MANIHYKLVAMAFMWATSYPIGRYLASYEAPQAVVVSRTLVAYLLLVTIARVRGDKPLQLTPKVAGQIFILGICGFCLHNFLMFEALEHTQASTGAVINGAIPIAVVLLDYVLFRRGVSGWSVLGVVISFIGVMIVVTHGEIMTLLSGEVGYGETLFLIAIMGWALYSIAARPLLERYPATRVTANACLAGCVLMFPWMIWNWKAAASMLSHPGIILLLIVQAIAAMGLGFLWYYEGVQKLGPLNAAAYLNLVPIFGVLLAAITIGEIPNMALLTGGGLTIAGVLAINRAEAIRQRRTAGGLNHKK